MCINCSVLAFIDIDVELARSQQRVKRTDVWKGGRFGWQKLVDRDLVYTQRHQYRHACNSTKLHTEISVPNTITIIVTQKARSK